MSLGVSLGRRPRRQPADLHLRRPRQQDLRRRRPWLHHQLSLRRQRQPRADRRPGRTRDRLRIRRERPRRRRRNRLRPARPASPQPVDDGPGTVAHQERLLRRHRAPRRRHPHRRRPRQHHVDTYDAAGDKTTATDGEGDKTLYGYDTGTGGCWPPPGLAGRHAPPARAAAALPPAQGCTTYAYDARGNTTTTTDSLGHTTPRRLRRRRQPDLATDGNGKKTVYGHDAADRPTSVTQPDGTSTQTVYNGDGTVLKTIDGAGNSTAYTYDGQGRQASRTDPDNRKTTWLLRRGGERHHGDRSDQPHHHLRLRPGRRPHLESTTPTRRPPTSPPIEYDPAGRRTSMTDGTGTSTWTYDIFGN